VTPLACEFESGRQRGMRRTTFAEERLPEIELRLDADKTLVEDHVHYARHSVRAVCRGSAARDRLDSGHEHGRNHVQIDGATVGSRHEPARVHERERARAVERVQAPQIGEGGADVGGADDPDVRVRLKGGVLRDDVQRLRHVDLTELLDRLGAHDSERIRRVESNGAFNAGAGDVHFFQLAGAIGRRRLRRAFARLRIRQRPRAHAETQRERHHVPHTTRADARFTRTRANHWTPLPELRFADWQARTADNGAASLKRNDDGLKEEGGAVRRCDE
jgi:hypothetical protein